MRSADDLQVVVREPDRAEPGRRQHGNPDVDVGQIGPQQRRHERRRQDQQPAHRRRAGLQLVRRRAFLPDDLADLEFAQLPDEPRPEQQADRERRQAGGRRAERDVARHVQHRELRAQREQHLEEQVVEHQANSAFSRSTTSSVRTPRDPFTRITSPGRTSDAARLGRLRARRDVLHALAREPARDGRAGQGARRSAADRNQQIEPGRRGRAADVFVQLHRAIAEFEHLAEHGDPAARRLGRAQHVERAARGGRAGVVAVVDHDDALRQPDHLAAVRRGLRPRRAFRHRGQRHVALDGDGRRRQHVREVAASERAASSARPAPAASRHARSCRRSRDRRRSRRARRPAARCRTSRRGRRTTDVLAAIRSSSALATSTVSAVAPSRISAFASAMASIEPKNPTCASPTLVQTRTSGSAMPHERADFARVVHAQLHDGHVGPRRQLDERQRQADVVVQSSPGFASRDTSLPETPPSLPSSSSCPRCR